MTNFEKYKDDVLAIVEQNISFAESNGKIKKCSTTICSDCKFSNGLYSCVTARIKWLFEEAAPTLTKTERAFCEIVEYGYIARDEDGGLFLFCDKPKKKARSWVSPRFYKHIADTCFTFVRWKDEKPWSIEDLLKLEVEECQE